MTLFFLVGCSVSLGVSHKVGRGETLYRIAKAYDVDVQDLAEWNGVTDTTRLSPGQRIFIPGAVRHMKIEPYRQDDNEGLKREEKEIEGKEASGKSEKGIILEKGRFSWPLKGRIISQFGMRNGKKHDGVDIAAVFGTPVRAAADGEVLFSDNDIMGYRGYGNIVILRHRDDFTTIYAHNRENLVRAGDTVKTGDIIARVGDSGNASGPHLHFEVRMDNRPRNPLFFLP